MKNKKLQWVLFIFAILVVIGLCIYLIPKVLLLNNPENRQKFIELINSFGLGGYLIMLGIQIIQVIIAFIPGEPIEIIAGMMYGTFGGLLLCLVGCIIGSTFVFLLVKKLGINFVNKIINSEKFQSYDFLKNPDKRDSLIFTLFLIPGTPKDVLTYFAPFTGIKLLKFLFIIMIARIPSIISSTYAGATLSRGELWKSVVIFLICGLIGLGGIIINNHFLKHNKRENTNQK